MRKRDKTIMKSLAHGVTIYFNVLITVMKTRLAAIWMTLVLSTYRRGNVLRKAKFGQQAPKPNNFRASNRHSHVSILSGGLGDTVFLFTLPRNQG